MLLSTRAVAYNELSTQDGRRLGGSWSWMNTTVPAETLSGPAVAAGPMTRLARIATAPASNKTERLRMYSLHPRGLLPIFTRAGGRLATRAAGVAGTAATRRSRCLHRHGQVQDHTSVTTDF